MVDVILDHDQDIKIDNGDFVLGDSTYQHVELMFISTPGDWKEHIETGIAIERAAHGNVDRFLDRTIRVQLEADGFKTSNLQISPLGISINGNYDRL
ncbi:hypothetical protein B0A58_07455 [Flavobacterium branchiophilum NBRC 15030 = ATCC 35035]|uniref:Uncharacterized protein n=1 Tax=Flavobacterium branchiophilum TaxID=55197 RepID=A0A543G141_9FLAO|nr:hypothetical protein [Flavobacterium branchiophilum]OXA76400.1 hypothetical protein B0A58_07455 [Flavobacterium branchiophilum NBRC 15030 = ATCC 35035]TQM39775.1 hypothetical protein BC670_0606 [Flavobacterium branchiophilum]GEM55236.1 hypothetical protein FB1_14570 [Flavobacterium branchiophilum NBRC 15030 = ATCC 35035]